MDTPMIPPPWPLSQRAAFAESWAARAGRRRHPRSPLAFLERQLALAVLADVEAEEAAELTRWEAQLDALLGVLASLARFGLFYLAMIGLFVVLGYERAQARELAALLTAGAAAYTLALAAWRTLHRHEEDDR